jgi:hypothetical protein
MPLVHAVSHVEERLASKLLYDREGEAAFLDVRAEGGLYTAVFAKASAVSKHIFYIPLSLINLVSTPESRGVWCWIVLPLAAQAVR